MDMMAMECHGCGSTNVDFDPKKRILTCKTCGKVEYYTRATLNASGRVVYGKRNAINFFTSGDFTSAQHYALDVLNVSVDHVPALYILAFYNEFTARRDGSLQEFFKKVGDVALEYDEIQDLRELFIASASLLKYHEEEVIACVAANMQAPEEAQDLCEFIDKVCPYWIARRTSAAYLTPNLASHYGELAQHCNIPKTCLALLKSIETNPDSPYVGNSFYLREKTRYFYTNYMVPIGEIIKRMANQAYRAKFWTAYEKLCRRYENDAQIG